MSTPGSDPESSREDVAVLYTALMSAISDLKNDQWNRLEFLRVKVGSLSKDLAHMSERIKETVDGVEKLSTRVVNLESKIVATCKNFDGLMSAVSRQRCAPKSGIPSSTTTPGTTAAPSAKPTGPPAKVFQAAIINKRVRGNCGYSHLKPNSCTEMPGGVDTLRPTPSSDGDVDSTLETSPTPKKMCIERSNTDGVNIGAENIKTTLTDQPTALPNKMKTCARQSVKAATVSHPDSEVTRTQTTSPRKVPLNHGGVQTRADKRKKQLMENEEALIRGRIDVYVMPNSIKSKFRPTFDMGVMMADSACVAYLFHSDLSDSEDLLRMGELVANRKDFECFVPFNKITADIIEWSAMKATRMQQLASEKTIWSLPPSFTIDINEKMTILNLKAKYKSWMPASPAIKYIYVPIPDVSTNHWYLMVVSITDRVIHHLDSNIQEHKIEAQRETMTILCNVIRQLLTPPDYPSDFLDNVFDQEKWEITDAAEIPVTRNRNDSALRVLDWMGMEHKFTVNIPPKINERAVRMRLATEMFRGKHNELWTAQLMNDTKIFFAQLHKV